MPSTVMYVSDPDMSHLRQGDVISNLCLPRFKTSRASFLHQINIDGSLSFQNRAVVDTNMSMSIVLSQCCEFNPDKRKSFSLISLLPIKLLLKRKSEIWGINLAELVPLARSPFRGRKGRESDQIARLRAANMIDTNARQNEALNAFLFEADGVILQEPYVADFSRVTSLSMKDFDLILKNKVLQLDSENRRLFQMKLAYFYARSSEKDSEKDT